MAQDLRIENTAGAVSGQAVALLSESEQSVLYRCSLQGYQDTLYARKNKQFYRECLVSGTVDCSVPKVHDFGTTAPAW